MLVGHETTYAAIENHNFFTTTCHRQASCPTLTKSLEWYLRHVLNCQLYLRLIVQEATCKVCGKHFLSKRSVSQHIGTHHQKELLDIKNQNGASGNQ